MYPVVMHPGNHMPPSLAYQVASFFRLVWLNDMKGDDRFWNFFESPEVVAHFTISERDVLISHAQVLRRDLEHLGSRYVMYGVGGVMTYPAFRGEGYGHRVVEATTDFIRNSEADVGILFTGMDLHPFYRQHGWQALERDGVYHGDPQQPEFNDAHTMILPVSAHGQAHIDDFARGELYVGAHMF